MADFINAALSLARFCAFIGSSGAVFAFGVAAVCKAMNWAPVNVTVTINNPPGTASILANPPTKDSGA